MGLYKKILGIDTLMNDYCIKMITSTNKSINGGATNSYAFTKRVKRFILPRIDDNPQLYIPVIN